MIPDLDKKHIETQMAHGGFERTNYMETGEVIFATSGFVYSSAEEAEATFNGEIERHQYTRFTNPTNDIFEKRLALLEGAERCLSTASGMAAVYGALAGIVSAGDHIVAGRAMFGSCFQVITNILPRFGVTYELVDNEDLSAWEKALSKPTKAIFIESPSNPNLKLTDIRAVSQLAHQAGAMVVVDNVFASPMGQRPLELGADIVVYSATKHIDGQGRVLGGAVLGKKELLEGQIMHLLRNTGPCLSPFNAWVLLKGLETLPLRFKAQSDTALKVAEWLESQPAVERVHYPFLKSHPQHQLALETLKGSGNMVTFDLRGGKASAFKFLNGLKLGMISNNLGDSKTILTHPATTTHRSVPVADRPSVGVLEGTIRCSIGLEHADDVIADFAQSLSAL